MKVLVFFLLTIVVTHGFDDNIWKGFKEKFHKKYQSIKDELAHHITYLKNLQKIAAHNIKYSKGEVNYYLAENEYADITFDEFRDHLGLTKFAEPNLENVTLFDGSSDGAPSAFDWRDRGLNMSVKNQLSCGSCWAFGTIGSLECRYFAATGKNIRLSEQQLLDCAGEEYGNRGCNGGGRTGSYDYLKKYGINYEHKYPYAGKQGPCRYSASNNAPINITGYTYIKDNEESLKEGIYTRGCFKVSIQVTSNFQLYGGGVFEDSSCTNRPNHAVYLTGYGRENNKDFWILKNSWGSDWGNNGYMKILRNHNECAIAQYAFSPDISDKFHKKYQSIKDDLVHHITYLKNLRKIVEHNIKYSKGEVNYYLAENEYTDLTFDEFRDHLGLSNFTEEIPPGNGTLFVDNSVGAPEAFDWREQGLYRDVKNQASCGSCWAFATIGTVECGYFRKTKKNIRLSEQQLMDCAGSKYGNYGCNGGWFAGSYIYLQQYGSNYENKYPYRGIQGTCRYSAANNAPLKVTGYQVIENNENSLKEGIYSRGCLGVALHVNSNFRFYSGGVFEDSSCPTRPNHGVLLVGYGRENNKDYWIIKNSWGPSWGDGGYMKILRNRNQCGIAKCGFSPDISV